VYGGPESAAPFRGCRPGWTPLPTQRGQHCGLWVSPRALAPQSLPLPLLLPLPFWSGTSTAVTKANGNQTRATDLFSRLGDLESATVRIIVPSSSSRPFVPQVIAFPVVHPPLSVARRNASVRSLPGKESRLARGRAEPSLHRAVFPTISLFPPLSPTGLPCPDAALGCVACGPD
jgi:hypothetical protein